MARRIALAGTLAAVLLLSALTGCAPKKVRIYETSTETARAEVTEAALIQQGKPYRSGAKGPDAFDCSGLVHYAFKQKRISLPVTAELQGRAGYEIARDGTQPGDLVLFKVDRDLHIGIMVGPSDFVHASKSRGVVLDSVDAAYWRKRLIGFRSVF